MWYWNVGSGIKTKQVHLFWCVYYTAVIINFTSENICRINFTCRNPPGLSNMDIKTTTPPLKRTSYFNSFRKKSPCTHPSSIHHPSETQGNRRSPLPSTPLPQKQSQLHVMFTYSWMVKASFLAQGKRRPLCKARNVLPISPAVSESFDKLFAKNHKKKPSAQAFSQHQTTSFILETQSQQKVEFGG